MNVHTANANIYLNRRRLKESFACSHFQKVQQRFQKILLKHILEYAL